MLSYNITLNLLHSNTTTINIAINSHRRCHPNHSIPRTSILERRMANHFHLTAWRIETRSSTHTHTQCLLCTHRHMLSMEKMISIRNSNSNSNSNTLLLRSCRGIPVRSTQTIPPMCICSTLSRNPSHLGMSSILMHTHLHILTLTLILMLCHTQEEATFLAPSRRHMKHNRELCLKMIWFGSDLRCQRMPWHTVLRNTHQTVLHHKMRDTTMEWKVKKC